MAATKRGTANTIAVLAIFLLSICGGLLARHFLREYRLREYPRKYSEYVKEYSLDCRIPDYSVYAVIKVVSGFDASLNNDGKTGLFQLTADDYYRLSDPDDAPDPGLLYEPECSIKLGCRLISSLYEKYGEWDAVWCAIFAGEDKTDSWMKTGQGGERSLGEVPEDAAGFIESVNKAIKIYRSLYDEELFGSRSE